MQHTDARCPITILTGVLIWDRNCRNWQSEKLKPSTEPTPICWRKSIWRELRQRGIRVGKQRVQRLMQQHGIRACGKRHFRVTTTDSRHDLFSREVVGWSMPPDMHCSLAIDALEMDVISVVPNQGD